MEYEDQPRLWSVLSLRVTWARPSSHDGLNFCSASQFHSQKSEGEKKKKVVGSLWAKGTGL